MNQSSDEDAPLTHANSSKRRRMQNQRACDRCRQKKIRCDGTQLGTKCSHCSSSGTDCIYTELSKVRGPPKRLVGSLETRLEKMEGMLSRLYPDGDFSQEMELDGWSRGFQSETSTVKEEQSPRAKSASPPVQDSPHPFLGALDLSESCTDDSDADVKYGTQDLLHSLSRLSVKPNPRRYFGKSSGISLMRTAMSVKSKAASAESPGAEVGRNTQRRKEFWYLHPWELARFQTPRRIFDFPEPDLLVDLIELYFNVVGPMVPLLHRPTFMRAWGDNLHLRDEKYSEDPRVLLENGHWHSAGWKWFRQVEPFSSAVLSGPELYDLQTAALTVIYVHGALPPQEGWIMVGVALRLAQDVGAHRRRRSLNAPPTVEDELWKRAFWVLLMLDIWVSSVLGRPCAMTEESHDVDLPIECDDEYWEHSDPALAFKQPPGRPSHVSYFNCLIKINLLHSHALHTIYSVSRSTVLPGPFPREKGWEEHTVADLDSALNSWFDSIPDHLRWDPHREDETFFVQSVFLRSAYYFIQITIHRPFIPSYRKGSSLSFAALAICASAARSFSHVADTLLTRYPTRTPPNMLLPAFVSATILLLSLWGAKRTGTSLDPLREMQDVRKCLKMLERAESRWSVAGRLRDLLIDLTTAGNLPIPAASPPSNKREREDSDDESQKSSVTLVSTSPVPYLEVPSTSADILPHRTSVPPAVLMSSPSTLASAMPSDMFHAQSRPLPPSPNEISYQVNYVPLGGSSGLGKTGGIRPSTTAVASAPTARPPTSTASYGGLSPLSNATSFAMSGNGANETFPPVPTSSASMAMALGGGALYDTSASIPTSASTTVPNSPQHGYDAAAAGMFDLSGMQFGGYGVPRADKEAILRHWAPVLQDGQIGVDQDTMMMWSTMPSTYETQDWVTYMSSMLDLGNANVDPAAATNDGIIGAF